MASDPMLMFLFYNDQHYKVTNCANSCAFINTMSIINITIPFFFFVETHGIQCMWCIYIYIRVVKTCRKSIHSCKYSLKKITPIKGQRCWCTLFSNYGIIHYIFMIMSSMSTLTFLLDITIHKVSFQTIYIQFMNLYDGDRIICIHGRILRPCVLKVNG